MLGTVVFYNVFTKLYYLHSEHFTEIDFLCAV